MKKVDYIVAGMGLAGAALAWRMKEAGLRIMVFDPCRETSASLVAAGIVNPVTGRRLRRSWRIDSLLKAVRELYPRMERELGVSCWQDMPVYKLLTTKEEHQEWKARLEDAEYLPFMSEPFFPDWAGIRPEFGVGRIEQGGWLDTELLLTTLRRHFEQNGLLVRENLDHGRLDLSASASVRYGDIETRAVVFCEGYAGRNNPFFEDLPLSFAKGEIMRIRCPELKVTDGILNRRGFIVPTGGDEFRVGATFSRDDLEEIASNAGLDDLKRRFVNLVHLEFEVLDIRAGIRPTSMDYRPLLGTSTMDSRLHVFNGLGTKGVSQAAWCSARMLDHLESGRDLPEDADLNRFSPGDRTERIR